MRQLGQHQQSIAAQWHSAPTPPPSILGERGAGPFTQSPSQAVRELTRAHGESLNRGRDYGTDSKTFGAARRINIGSSPLVSEQQRHHQMMQPAQGPWTNFL